MPQGRSGPNWAKVSTMSKACAQSAIEPCTSSAVASKLTGKKLEKLKLIEAAAELLCTDKGGAFEELRSLIQDRWETRVSKNATVACFYATELATLAERHSISLKDESEIQHLRDNFILLSVHDYLQAFVVSLPMAYIYRKTDYGEPRQRDLGQVVTDSVRGALGEIAFVQLWEKKTGQKILLKADEMKLEEALQSDIQIGGKKIGIKTTKFRGYWLDVPYKQSLYSDLYVLMKIAVPPDHFFIELFGANEIRSPLLGYIKENLNSADARIYYEDMQTAVENFTKKLENFTRLPIPGYFAGYIEQNKIADKFSFISLEDFSIGRKYITIRGGKGTIPGKREDRRKEIVRLVQEYLNRQKSVENDPQLRELDNLRIKFEGINNFSSDASHAIGHIKVLNSDLTSLRNLL